MAVKDLFKKSKWADGKHIAVIFLISACILTTGIFAFCDTQNTRHKEAMDRQRSFDSAIMLQVYDLASLSGVGSDVIIKELPCGHGVSQNMTCDRYIFTSRGRSLFQRAIDRYNASFPGKRLPSANQMRSFLEHPPYVYAVKGKLTWPQGMKGFLAWLKMPAKLKYAETGINADGSILHRVGDPVPEDSDITNWVFITEPGKYRGYTW